MLAVGGHVLVFLNTFLNDAHGSTRSFARARDTLLNESEAVVHEHTVTSGIKHVTIQELLLGKGDKVPAVMNHSHLQGNSWSKTPDTSHTAPVSSPASPLPSWSSPQHPRVISRRTHEHPCTQCYWDTKLTGSQSSKLKSAIRQATLRMPFHDCEGTNLHVQLRNRTSQAWFVIADHARRSELLEVSMGLKSLLSKLMPNRVVPSRGLARTKTS